MPEPSTGDAAQLSDQLSELQRQGRYEDAVAIACALG
jgi:hypothetical protein